MRGVAQSAAVVFRADFILVRRTGESNAPAAGREADAQADPLARPGEVQEVGEQEEARSMRRRGEQALCANP